MYKRQIRNCLVSLPALLRFLENKDAYRHIENVFLLTKDAYHVLACVLRPLDSVADAQLQACHECIFHDTDLARFA